MEWKDKILKERLFGLGNCEGNHGEDVKELYYYLDNIPTHYYMEILVQISAKGISLPATLETKTANAANWNRNMKYWTPEYLKR